jgi:hypothetical protein
MKKWMLLYSCLFGIYICGGIIGFEIGRVYGEEIFNRIRARKHGLTLKEYLIERKRQKDLLDMGTQEMLDRRYGPGTMNINTSKELGYTKKEYYAYLKEREETFKKSQS